jgi:hypothetical protein
MAAALKLREVAYPSLLPRLPDLNRIFAKRKEVSEKGSIR